MREQLHINTWARKDHFKYFKDFEEPYFGISTNIDCTYAYSKCKNENISFFLYYLHKSLVAANKIKQFRYRLDGGKVFLYDKIHASPTIARPDGTFGFSYMTYYENFEEFQWEAEQVIKHIQKSRGLEPAGSGENVIHFSSLPWIDFTSVSHARKFSSGDSCPKISFGKISQQESIIKMPVSVHVHHALMDGYHVGQFINSFQKLMK